MKWERNINQNVTWHDMPALCQLGQYLTYYYLASQLHSAASCCLQQAMLAHNKKQHSTFSLLFINQQQQPTLLQQRPSWLSSIAAAGQQGMVLHGTLPAMPCRPLQVRQCMLWLPYLQSIIPHTRYLNTNLIYSNPIHCSRYLSS